MQRMSKMCHVSYKQRCLGLNNKNLCLVWMPVIMTGEI